VGTAIVFPKTGRRTLRKASWEIPARPVDRARDEVLNRAKNLGLRLGPKNSLPWSLEVIDYA
jgi:hypothetical protein